MSMPLVALCADEECFRHPELLGLDGENLLAQQWLMPFTSAEAARAALRDAASVQEVWVVSCADVAPINLAAALKRDRADRRVCMLTAQESGSLRSRTTAAGVDASLTRQALRQVRAVQQGCHAGDRSCRWGSALGPLRASRERPAAPGERRSATPSAASKRGVVAVPTTGFSGDVEVRHPRWRWLRLRGSGREDRMRRRMPRRALPPHRRRRPLPQPLPPMGPHRGWGLLEAPRLRRRTRNTLRRRAFCCRW